MRRLSSHPWRAAACVLAVGGVAAGLGSAAHAGGVDGKHPTSPERGEEPLAGAVWRDLGPEERAESLRKLSRDEAEALTEFLDKVAAGEPVPVAAEGEIVGVVDPDEVDGNEMPESKKDLAPVRDETGRTVAYWGGPLGVLDRDTAEKPGLDLRHVASKRGLNPDGTVRKVLLDQVPVAPLIVAAPSPTSKVLPPPLSIRWPLKTPHTRPR